MDVLITGGTRGIGAGLAAAYQARGAKVYAPGSQDLPVTDPAAVAAQGAAWRRPLDLLVCNAGIYPDRGKTLHTTTADDFADAFAVNVTGVFLTIQAFLPALQKSGGKIAIISSMMASSERAPGGSYVYRSSKAAVLNLGRNLASDLKGHTAVGIYHPGWVVTDMGGSHADITVDEAITGLMSRFDALDLARTGEFLAYDGTPIAY